MRIPKKPLLIVLAVIITAGNGGVLAWALAKHQRLGTTPTTVQAVLPIKSVKQQDVGISQQGKLLGKGAYKFENLAQSKINRPDKGKLVLASEKAQQANFLLALGASTDLNGKVNLDDWQLQTLAEDSMWLPGACASKPTYVLNGKNVFIDDGKTHPEDRYNSYITYDMNNSTYRYFGGDNFTDDQANKEKILKTANENDQLVFYLDLSDSKGPLLNSTTFKHARGNEHGYIVRRVIDPVSLVYTDYSLPYSVPNGVDFYYLGALGSDKFTLGTDQGAGQNFDGLVTDNRINFNPSTNLAVSTNQNGPTDTPLEKILDASLASALHNFAKDPPYENSPYATKFSLTEVGAYKTNQYLIARERYGSNYETPVIYDTISKNLTPLLSEPYLSTNAYVPLGVF